MNGKEALMIPPEIRTAMASDEDHITNVILLAFSADPVVRWVWPDSRQYFAHFPSFVRAFGGKAFTHGSAYYIEGYVGAALWLPPDIHIDENEIGSVLERSVSEKTRKDVFAVFEQMGSYHPSEPHWYLPLMAVDPSKQGKGFGSALMEHALLQCDRDHKLAYLEASNPRNKPLYERHGFELLGTIQAGSSPPFFPMLRKPQR